MNKYFFIIIGLLFFLAGCSDSTKFQCDRIYRIADEVAKETKSLTDNQGRAIDKESWLLAADKIEQASEKLKNLDIKDVKLQEYKTTFARVYQDYADATREIIQIIDTNNKTAARYTQLKVKQAGQLEKETGRAFNDYCRQNS